MISVVEQVLTKLKIDFKPRKNGLELQFRCINPNHNDRHASASINTKTGQWKCFSCLKGGNLRTLVKIVGGDDAEWETLVTPLDSVKMKIGAIYKDSAEQILSYENAADFAKTFEILNADFVPATTNIDSLRYLVKKRKLTKELIRQFNLKYCTTGQYAERIIIPYTDRGEVVGFNSRYIGDNPKTLRYLYFLNNEKFESFIFNYENIKNYDYCILAEGPFDLMYLVQNGYKNVISTLNTNISRHQMMKILKFKKIIFCFDNDEVSEAGQKAVLKHAESIFNYAPNMPIFKVELPVGKDPNECLPIELQMAFGALKRIRIDSTPAPALTFECRHINGGRGML